MQLEKATNCKNDLCSFLKINDMPYTKLILYDSNNLPADSKILVKKLLPTFEYHPDMLVMLTRMNALPYIL